MGPAPDKVANLPSNCEAGIMRPIRPGIAVLALAGLLLGSAAQAQIPKDYAAGWRAMGEVPRELYLLGVRDGGYSLEYYFHVFLGDYTTSDITMQRLGQVLDSSQKRLLAAALRFEEESTDMTDRIPAVAATISELYGDPRNAFIPWWAMSAPAVLRITGGSAAEVEELLAYKRNAISK